MPTNSHHDKKLSHEDWHPTPPGAAPESPETATDEGKAKAEAETEQTPVRQAARFVWAMLLARIYEVFPLICPKWGGTMKIIAFIDEGEAIREILTHLGEPVDPPCVAPARGPPLWEAAGQCGDDLLIQPLPEYEFDQRIAWGDVVSGPLTLPDGRVRVCYPENERRRAFSG